MAEKGEEGTQRVYPISAQQAVGSGKHSVAGGVRREEGPYDEYFVALGRKRET